MDQSFDFISDPQLQQIIIRDFAEVQKCMEVGAYKSVLLLSGSIVESILLDYFRTYPSYIIGDSKLNNLSLNEFLEMAEKESVITHYDNNLASVIKDYRNFIHPSRETRSKVAIDIETAKVSVILLDIVIKRIIDKQSLIEGYKASQIMSKLINDKSFHTIYSLSISKLNKYQKVLLLGLLVDYDKKIKSSWEELIILDSDSKYQLWNELFSSELERTKDFLLPLLSQVPKSLILDYLNKLVIEVETGELFIAVSLFHLFDSQLNLLSDHNRDTVICYILDIFSLLYDSERIAHIDFYLNVGKYIHSEITKNALIKTVEFCIVNTYYKVSEICITNLKQLLTNVDSSLHVHITSTLQQFYEYCLTDGPDQNDMRNCFFAPAIRRKIISVTDSKVSLIL